MADEEMIDVDQNPPTNEAPAPPKPIEFDYQGGFAGDLNAQPIPDLARIAEYEKNLFMDPGVLAFLIPLSDEERERLEAQRKEEQLRERARTAMQKRRHRKIIFLCFAVVILTALGLATLIIRPDGWVIWFIAAGVLSIAAAVLVLVASKSNSSGDRT